MLLIVLEIIHLQVILARLWTFNSVHRFIFSLCMDVIIYELHKWHFLLKLWIGYKEGGND